MMKKKILLSLVLCLGLIYLSPFLKDLFSELSENTQQQLPPEGLLVPTKKSHPFGFKRKNPSNDFIDFTGSTTTSQYIDITGSTYSTSTNLIGYHWIYSRETRKKNGFYPNNIHYEELTKDTQRYDYNQIKEKSFKSSGFGIYFREFMYNNQPGFIRIDTGEQESSYDLFWDDNGKLLSIQMFVDNGIYADKDVINLLMTMRRSKGSTLEEKAVSDSLPVFTTERMTNPDLLLKLKAKS